MSNETPRYNQLYITAWTILSISLGLVFFGMLVFGDPLLAAGKSAWDLIRWLASPLI